MTARVLTDVKEAARLLRAGKLVAIPTETVYGLGGNALNERAAAAIFAAKDRPAFDPLIIHQASADRVFEFAWEIPEQAVTLAETFWPGPLTLVLPKGPRVPDLVTAGLDTVAVRVPQHPLTLSLLQRLDFPLAAPSANPFGYVSPTRAGHVVDQLGDRISAVLDGGPCTVGLESTIVGFPKGQPVVYRKGGLAVEALEEALDTTITVREHGNSRPAAPGMLTKHYSPGIPIGLRDVISGTTPVAEGGALVVFGRGRGRKWLDEARNAVVYDMAPSGDLAEAASGLFALLRKLRASGHPEAVIELVPETGLGRAINDRLRRAAAT